MHLPLDQTQIRNVFFASQRLLNAWALEELHKEALPILQGLFKAEKGNFFLACENRQRAVIDLCKVSSRGITDKNLRLFRQYYHQLDPFKKVLKNRMPPAQVITFEQIIPHAKRLKTEYYNDFLKPQNIHDQLAVYLMSGGQFLGVMALFRSKEAPAFSPADATIAKLIAPTLAAALERSLSIKKNGELEQAISTIAPDLPYKGILILDTSLSPLYYNASAVGIISELHQSEGRQRSFPENLPGELCTAAGELLALLKRPDPKPLPRLELTFYPEDSAKKVVAHLRVQYDKNSTPRILVCFNPSKKPLNSGAALQRLGVSPRERDIIRLAAEGKKNSEIANALFISEYTVENHLRSIYRKMDVKNRTALVHKLIKIS